MRGQGNIRLHDAYSFEPLNRIAWPATCNADTWKNINGQDSVQALGMEQLDHLRMVLGRIRKRES